MSDGRTKRSEQYKDMAIEELAESIFGGHLL